MNEVRIFLLWRKVLLVFLAQILLVATVHSVEMTEARAINKTRELIKASGATGLFEHIEKCQKKDARSCFALGAAFVFSKGVKKNSAIGIYWETRAAELGYSDAQYNLSIEYRDGLSVEKNIDRGIYWEQLAADNGHPAAMFNLALAACDGQRKKHELQGWNQIFSKICAKRVCACPNKLGSYASSWARCK